MVYVCRFVPFSPALHGGGVLIIPGVVYSGAGISTASGVPDYATRAAASEVTVPASPWHARPTKAHKVLVNLFKQGLLRRWFQQNHDGLPQKAGCPQHLLNEIHGSWCAISLSLSQYPPPHPNHLVSPKFADLARCGSSHFVFMLMLTRAILTTSSLFNQQVRDLH